MKDFILLMHADATREEPPESWERYFAKLRALGVFEGGSSIGAGTTLRKEGTPGPSADHLSGYIRVRAESLEAAKALVEGNPVYEAGGSVEVRELPRD
jgi:hypothetical protein